MKKQTITKHDNLFTLFLLHIASFSISECRAKLPDIEKWEEMRDELAEFKNNFEEKIGEPLNEMLTLHNNTKLEDYDSVRLIFNRLLLLLDNLEDADVQKLILEEGSKIANKIEQKKKLDPSL